MRDIIDYNKGEVVLEDTDYYQIINFGYIQLGSLAFMPDWGVDYNSFIHFELLNPFDRSEKMGLSPEVFIDHAREQLIKNNLNFGYSETFTIDAKGTLSINIEKLNNTNIGGL